MKLGAGKKMFGNREGISLTRN